MLFTSPLASSYTGNMNVLLPHSQPDLYPDSDGLPMSDNTLQWECMVTLKEGLEAQYADDPNVFVAGDLLWYPVLGHPEIRTGADVMTVHGRPKGYRGSYKQWEEGGLPLQTTFEILSPGNRPAEMRRKFLFYERYGVEEYYVYDPYTNVWQGWLRGDDGQLHAIASMEGWVSPRLGIRFSMQAGDLELYHPDNRRFTTFVELAKKVDAEKTRADHAETEAKKAKAKAQKAKAEVGKAKAEVGKAKAKAKKAQAEAEKERERAERLAERLRSLGITLDDE
jgi:Uma2 family endonuclease